MLRLKFRTLPSAKATTMAECGVFGVDQSQTVGSLAEPVIFGPT
jgi:hypothetical protein